MSYIEVALYLNLGRKFRKLFENYRYLGLYIYEFLTYRVELGLLADYGCHALVVKNYGKV